MRTSTLPLAPELSGDSVIFGSVRPIPYLVVMPSTLRLSLTAAIAALALIVAAVPAAAAAAVPASTPTVTLLVPAQVHTYPGASAPTTAVVAATRPLTGNPTVLPVIGSARANGREWVRVRLPQRPDGDTGWISTAGTRTGMTPWHIVVSRALRQASIYESGKLVQTFSVIVGKLSSPTPSGHFFVAEVVDEGYGTVSGPFALATSAYSNVYQEFEGGPGQVALHGIVGLYDPIGTAASHGCVRFADANIVWLAAHVGAGTPVDIS